jgi:E3 ubiquitin-protein ligase ZSWIM2
MLPTAIVQSLATREISDQDYDLLLQLDQASNQGPLSQIPEKVIKAWPCERVKENSKLLDPGIQCRICLRAYQPSQIVRKLPSCKHKFHADCIDNWLLHSHPTCPIDGQVVWDPVTAQQEKENKK